MASLTRYSDDPAYLAYPYRAIAERPYVLGLNGDEKMKVESLSERTLRAFIPFLSLEVLNSKRKGRFILTILGW